MMVRERDLGQEMSWNSNIYIYMYIKSIIASKPNNFPIFPPGSFSFIS